MDWMQFGEVLGNYGEFLGAIAVVVTLGFLVKNTRQNTESMNVASELEVFRQVNDINSTMIADPAILKGFMTTMNTPDEATDVELNRTALIFRCYANSFYLSWSLLQRGAATEDLWRVSSTAHMEVLGSPGGRQWWQANANIYNPAFIAAIDDILAGNEEAPQFRWYAE